MPKKEFKRVSYTLTCDECGDIVATNLEIAELLDGATPQFSPHRRKGDYHGGLWRSTQSAIVRHHDTHTIPEPVDSDGRTDRMRSWAAMR